jgi:hypothetical protein
MVSGALSSPFSHPSMLTLYQASPSYYGPAYIS